jgi:hypothetical protein
MPEIVQNAPNLTHFEVGVSPPDAIALRLTAEDGANFIVRIDRGIVGPMTLQMFAKASSLPAAPDGPSVIAPPMSAIGRILR